MRSSRQSFVSATRAVLVGAVVSLGSLAFLIWSVRVLPEPQVALLISFLAFSNFVGFVLAGFQIVMTRDATRLDNRAANKSPIMDLAFGNLPL
jgi:hypothetical protein